MRVPKEVATFFEEYENIKNQIKELVKELEACKKELLKEYPYWSSLSDDEKEIVNSIAMQIPISCEEVAVIFIHHGMSDKQKTIEYIYRQYGFLVD